MNPSLMILLLVANNLLWAQDADVEMIRNNSIPKGIHGLTMDPLGSIYFADTYSRLDDNSRVYRLDKPYTGKPEATSIQGQSIAGLMWFQNRLYVAHFTANEIVIYDENLDFLESRPVNSPWNLENDGENVYVISYEGEVGIVTNNRVKPIMNELVLPFDMAYSGDQSLWVGQPLTAGEEGKLIELDYRGDLLQEVVGVTEPRGLVVTDRGFLYIADRGSSTLLKFNGEELSTISTFDAPPVCLEKMPNGNLLLNLDSDPGQLVVVKTR